MDYSIGYMPHVEGNYNNSVQYTPMSIVYNDGKSYISKVGVQQVEPGVTTGWGDYWQNLTEGTQGVQGSKGAQGYNGSDGVQGATGANGQDGNDGAQGATGAQGISGEYAGQGAVGPQGPQGADGEQGSVGPQGAQGADGHSPANTEVWTFTLANNTTLSRTIYMVPQA